MNLFDSFHSLIPFFPSSALKAKVRRPKNTFQGYCIHLLHRDRLGQVAGEIDVQALGDGEPIGHQLERNDVQETLQAVDCLGDLDLLGLAILEFFVVGVADDDWLAAASNDWKVLAWSSKVKR